jgi:UPF0716 protein FxsA
MDVKGLIEVSHLRRFTSLAKRFCISRRAKMGKLFLLFLIVPLVEIWILVQMGGIWGATPTFGLVVFTALLGSYLAKREGRRVWESWQAAVQLGRPPSDGLVDTLLVVVGAVLLLTPGLVTDGLGFLLLVPISRRKIGSYIKQKIEESSFFQVQTQGIHSGFGGAPFSSAPPSSDPGRSDVVIEAEVVDVTGSSGRDA